MLNGFTLNIIVINLSILCTITLYLLLSTSIIETIFWTFVLINENYKTIRYKYIKENNNKCYKNDFITIISFFRIMTWLVQYYNEFIILSLLSYGNILLNLYLRYENINLITEKDK
jgi:hypothetical protein